MANSAGADPAMAGHPPVVGRKLVRRRLRSRVALGVFLLLGACSALPRAGPSTSEVVDRFKEGDNPLGVRMVDLSPAAVQALGQMPRNTLSTIDQLRSNRPIDRIGPGDVLAISIYEAGPGLFTNAQRQSGTGDSATSAETLPRVQVDRAGRIMVPFAGMVSVGGRTATEVQGIIQSRLAEKASEPQVIVTVVSGDTNSVIVSGDVKNPGRRPLTLAGESLLDIIALSGGPSHEPADTRVRMTRAGVTVDVPLAGVQLNPAENIRMEPQDRVEVDFAPRTFLVFGATGRVAQTNFDFRGLSLAEAIARAGGLDDNRADPKSVFLFREEPRAVAQSLGLAPDRPITPVIYRADLADPQNFFLMQRVAMQDKDLIYVANARTVQLYKFLQLIYTLVTPAVTAKELSP